MNETLGGDWATARRADGESENEVPGSTSDEWDVRSQFQNGAYTYVMTFLHLPYGVKSIYDLFGVTS